MSQLLEQKDLASAIRFLSVDAVEKAQSGHPGMPLGMADIATVLWTQFLKHNPRNPFWFNRDRFVLSNGHGSMLLYALLHLTGYDVSMEDLKAFRQLHSKTPGHPERLETPGVETTTGPLGQGLANAVGMAIAERHLAAQFNRNDYDIINHFTYVFAGDGCLMEGVSHEACSLAGTLKLGKLIVFYDANGISIDGQIDAWFTDNTKERFEAYHWHVVASVDGHDFNAIHAAILEAQAVTDKPSLIICKTVIGYGSTAAGTDKVHGAPLGEADIQQLRLRLNWPYPPFYIPEHIASVWSHTERGANEEEVWLNLLASYEKAHPRLHRLLLRVANNDLPDDWDETTEAFINACINDDTLKPIATRKASQHCLEAYAPHLPELLGGSADLTESNNTAWSHVTILSPESYGGAYIHYGVREFGMSAIMNGMAVHGGVLPYGGTFLAFSDYARGAVRLAALMKIQVIFVYTHDSIGLGEDGPTHQPIEHLPMLRMTPGLTVWRPADLVETAVAWQQALSHKLGPSCMVLSRQALSPLPHHTHTCEVISRGGYILFDTAQDVAPDIILLATGSEVQLAKAAAEQLASTYTALNVRVVSMPSVEQFLKQNAEYQAEVLPPKVSARIAIEASRPETWYQFVGTTGVVMGIESFGLSAPCDAVYEALGLTTEHIIEIVQKKFLEKNKS